MKAKTNNKCCEYAHYYFGARFRFTWPDGQFVEGRVEQFCDIYFMTGSDMTPGRDISRDDYYEIGDIRTDGNFQLFLLSAIEMTADQKKKYYALCFQFITKGGKLMHADTPASLDYLLKNHIDCFGLLRDGYALHLSIVNILDNAKPATGQ